MILGDGEGKQSDRRPDFLCLGGREESQRLLIQIPKGILKVGLESWVNLPQEGQILLIKTREAKDLRRQA